MEPELCAANSRIIVLETQVKNLKNNLIEGHRESGDGSDMLGEVLSETEGNIAEEHKPDQQPHLILTIPQLILALSELKH